MLSKQKSKSNWTELSLPGVNVHCVPFKTSAANLRTNHKFSENCQIELKPLHANMQRNISCEITYNIFKSYQRINILYPNYSFHRLHRAVQCNTAFLHLQFPLQHFLHPHFTKILELSATLRSFVQRCVHFPSLHSHLNDRGSNNFCDFTHICCQQLA